MKEYIKLFNNLSAATDYEIADIPFTSTVLNGENRQNLRCNEEGKKLSVSGDTVDVVVAVTMSTFYVNGIEYTYEVGMTWERWIASTYNTDGFIIYGCTVTTSVGYVIKTNGVSTLDSDLIDGTSTYTFDTSGQPK